MRCEARRDAGETSVEGGALLKRRAVSLLFCRLRSTDLTVAVICTGCSAQKSL